MQLEHRLAQKKEVILKRWVRHIIETYPEDTASFFKRQKDQFANPVGTTISRGLEAVLQELLEGMDTETIKSFLDPIVRMRAVQGFTPSQAVSFIFDLKSVVREILSKDAADSHAPDEFLAFEAKIDRLCLIAFDIFMQCREKLFELKANEVRNRTFRALQRANLLREDPAD